MTTNSMRDDLAFLRALAEGGEGNYRGLAEAYFAAGLIYGGQMVLHAGTAIGLLPASKTFALFAGTGPTVIFLIALAIIISRHGSQSGGSLVARSVGAVFGAVGIANLALIAVIGSVAISQRSVTIWLIYPCTVFVLQGAAWLVAFMLRRRAWHGLVAAGWFASGIAMAFSITYPPGFIAFASLGLFGCMALPGYLMLRRPASA